MLLGKIIKNIKIIKNKTIKKLNYIYSSIKNIYVNIFNRNNLRNYFLKQSNKFISRCINVFLPKNLINLYPKNLFIFLTTFCNLRCFICRRENFTPQHLPFDNLLKLKKAIKNALHIDITGWGEPLVYPKFEETLKYIYKLNNRDNLIGFSTNGTLLSAKIAKLLSGHLSYITISLNASNAKTYNRDMKNGDFNKTINNIEKFMQALNLEDKNKVRLLLVAHTNNIDNIKDFIILANKLNIKNVSITNYLINIKEHLKYGVFNIKKKYNSIIEKAKKLSMSLGISLSARQFFNEKEQPFNYMDCKDPYDSCFILPDGNVGPCCFCGSYIIGNAYKDSFESIWFGKEYAKLRREKHINSCKVCTPFIQFDKKEAHLTAYYKENKKK